MTEITISIVVPNYNHGHYLPTALDHALQQTTPAHEILIIDDGSTDNSLEVIKGYIDKHPQIRLLQNSKNMGVNYTINRGLREATGSHVTFAAADDWTEPNLLQSATNLLTLYPNAGFCSGAAWIVYEAQPHKRFAARMPYPMQSSGYITPDHAKKFLNSLDSWIVGNTVVLNRHYAIQEGGFLEELQSFTDNFLCRVLASKHGCCFTPDKLATWRICENGFAKLCNINVNKQIAMLNSTVQLMSNNYSNIFSAVAIYRVKQRLSFNIARTIWNNTNGKYSAELENFLNTTTSNHAARVLAKFSLTVANRIPIYNAKLGQLLLFLLIRPFDVWQQLRIMSFK